MYLEEKSRIIAILPELHAFESEPVLPSKVNDIALFEMPSPNRMANSNCLAVSRLRAPLFAIATGSPP
jgi:hypothetical protein